jgi:hypothetical protein
MRWGIAAVAVLLSIAGAEAQAPTVSEAKVTQVGIVDAQITGKMSAPGVVTGNIKRGTYRFVADATKIELRKGLNFGFEYRLAGAPDGARVAVRKVTIFPAPGLRNPQTGEVIARDEYIENNLIGEPVLKAYSLDNDWEAVPGEWIQQVWYGEQKLVEQKFTLTKP